MTTIAAGTRTADLAQTRAAFAVLTEPGTGYRLAMDEGNAL